MTTTAGRAGGYKTMASTLVDAMADPLTLPSAGGPPLRQEQGIAGSQATQHYTPITPGASLLLSFRPTGRTVLILGTRRLAASRIACLLESDVRPIVVGVDVSTPHTVGATSASEPASGPSTSTFASMAAELAECPNASDEVQWRVRQRQCDYLAAPAADTEEAWRRMIERADGPDRRLFAVCVTDTLHAGDDSDSDTEATRRQSLAEPESRLSPVARARLVSSICRSMRIPVNVADRPTLCDFSFPATHRFHAVPVDDLRTSQGEDLAAARTPSSLQIAVTTNGKGCRLAGRIRREIVAGLPNNVGDAVERIGAMRDLAKAGLDMAHSASASSRLSGRSTTSSQREPSMRRQALARTTSVNSVAQTSNGATGIDADEEDLAFDNTPLNSPVPQLSSPSEFDFRNLSVDQDESSDAAGAVAKLHEQYEALVEERRRRMRWVAQMSEYWPIEYIGALTHKDMKHALDTFKHQEDGPASSASGNGINSERRGRRCAKTTENGTSEEMKQAHSHDGHGRREQSQHSLALRNPQQSKEWRGHIFLVGSGTGHPGLLTSMAYRLLTSTDTDLVLSDKLVPSQILSLIPKSTPLRIARKFPGNAEGAQSELIELAAEAALEGKRVVRLKQGDPFIYGRGGEEVLAFRRHGIEATVIPGISSSIAAPLLLGIPVTQRGAADSLTLCTGVGRGGKVVALPGYERSRTLIVLMGVARLRDVVATLCHGWNPPFQDSAINTMDGATSSGDSLGHSPSGQRLGQPFPPYTPIAIIERASSSDQRLVASTLQNIESALARSGEQRPPGMMVIGWTVLALAGSGNVDILEDEAKCKDMGHSGVAELERRDRARVQGWLHGRDFVVREGLDAAYRRALGDGASATTAMLDFSTRDSSAAPTHEASTDAGQIDEGTSRRGPSGWAPARYKDNKLQGGWTFGEQSLDV